MRYTGWQAALVQASVVAGMLLTCLEPSAAQLRPVADDTLGNERSVLVPFDFITPGDRIDGGARRGDSLFHSFEEFHVDEGRSVYFADPGVENILGRVTGGVGSEILGVLGVIGDANLFLINPSGIVFGSGAQLNINGSFTATTADSAQFGGQGQFEASSGAAVPALLTVQPSAFLFNRANPAAIVNNSRTLPPTGLDAAPGGGLRVADVNRLTLLGGDVRIDNGGLSALGGRVEVGGLSEPGSVGFNTNGSLEFPDGVARSDVFITNGSRLSASDLSVGGGSVAITANTLEITDGSGVSAGTVGGTEFGEGQSGDITLNASSLRIANRSGVDNVVRGRSGNGGGVLITADELSILDRSIVQSTLLGEGSTGQVRIEARDRFTMDNSLILSNLGGSDRTTVATGDGGRIEITTPALLLTNGSQLQSGTFGQGNAGNVIINAPESVALESSSIFSEVFTNQAGTAATGNGGNIEITTPNLSLTNGSQLSSRTTGRGNGGSIQIAAGSLSLTRGSRLSTDSSGRGSAGNVEILIRDRTLLDQSNIFSNLEQAAEPADNTGNVLNAGNIQVETGSLNLINGAQIQSSTSGRGNAGNVAIQARDRISIEGINPNSPTIASSIFAIAKETAQGEGGNVSLSADLVRLADNGLVSATTSNSFPGGSVRVEANTLELIGGGRILTTTGGDGDAGNIDLDIAGQTILAGANTFTFNNEPPFFSGFFADTAQDSAGKGGTVNLSTSELQMLDRARIEVSSQGSGTAGTILVAADSLLLTGGSQFSTSSSGQGSAGNVEIEARDRILFDRSFIFSDLEQVPELADNLDNVRSAGNIQIETGSLELINGAQLQSSTGGRGNAGSITVRARDHVSIEGINPNNSLASAISALIREGAQGEGGDISLTADSVHLADGGQVRTATQGDGDAGDIRIAADSLSLTGRSQLSTGSSGQGSAGNVEIRTRDHALFDQSFIFSNLGQAAEPADDPGNVLNAGNIQIETGSLDLINGAQIQSSTSGRGNAGNVAIQARDRIFIQGVNPDVPSRASSIFALTRQGAQGAGGNVSLTADLVRLADNGLISTTTSSSSLGGNVTVNADTLELTGGGRILTTTRGDGRAGSINLTVAGQTTLAGANTFKVNNNPSFFSGLFASTTQDSTGGGGEVELVTSALQVLDQGRIVVDSRGSGTAGDIEITAETIRLDEGGLTAETAAVDGGNITLNDVGLLLLRDGSLISTTAGTAGAGGNGGNIIIEADAIVSVPDEDSNIRANAFSGSGGSVRINTSGLFGIATQAQDSPLTNDITASSEQGIQGTVDIATPETDPRSGLTELPAAFADASDQITQTCSGNRDGQSSEFIVTGRGGLPPSPIDALAGDVPLANWAVLDEPTAAAASETTSSVPDPTLSVEEGIVEAQGWTRENGKVKLITAAPASTVQTTVACQ